LCCTLRLISLCHTRALRLCYLRSRLHCVCSLAALLSRLCSSFTAVASLRSRDLVLLWVRSNCWSLSVFVRDIVFSIQTDIRIFHSVYLTHCVCVARFPAFLASRSCLCVTASLRLCLLHPRVLCFSNALHLFRGSFCLDTASSHCELITIVIANEC